MFVCAYAHAHFRIHTRLCSHTHNTMFVCAYMFVPMHTHVCMRIHTCATWLGASSPHDLSLASAEQPGINAPHFQYAVFSGTAALNSVDVLEGLFSSQLRTCPICALFGGSLVFEQVKNLHA